MLAVISNPIAGHFQGSRMAQIHPRLESDSLQGTGLAGTIPSALLAATIRTNDGIFFF